MRRFPWSQLKDQPDKLFLIQPTQSNTITSLTDLKGSRGLTGRERSQAAVCTPFMPGIKCWTRAEALKFGSDLSIKSRGPAFQLKSKMPAEPEAPNCPGSHQLHSEQWLFLWGNELFFCQDATNIPKGALWKDFFHKKKNQTHNPPPWNLVPDIHPFFTFLDYFHMLKIELLAYV